MNSFFGIGFMELFFIAVLALIVLGPERLPGAIRELAKHIRTIRNLSNELTSQFSEELQALDEINPQKILRELTEDPPEEKKKSAAKTASTGAAAGKASSSTSKPATTKPASAAKPATSAKPAAEATNGNGASTSKSENASNAKSNVASDSAQDTATTAESTPSKTVSDEQEPAPENSILPPELQAADDTESAASTPAPKHEQPTLAENAPVEASLDNTNGTGVAASDLPEKPEDGA